MESLKSLKKRKTETHQQFKIFVFDLARFLMTVVKGFWVLPYDECQGFGKKFIMS